MTELSGAARSPGAFTPETRAANTIKVFVLTGFVGEASFLVLGLVLFPDHGPLLWRLVWTLGLCGIGMGAAVGALTYLATAGLAPGSRASYAATAVSGALLFAVCQTLCWSLDHNVGLNYWGSRDMPALFLAKGYAGAVAGGLLGSFHLNSPKGAALMSRLGVFR
ncbi:hypothetical protein NX794_09195 [Streptomyces sp. LP11]|uniref:Integral membrane protein n=1 Tax=Streptomyces pyxinicus TaxID=2970331 RepID=A0ABT2AYR2_9ACTN|nr:hypothetical protein [Streptomyces sp. LP11]MCS0601402.1 hypothetical protein [Streptomyces sp. LP11]